MNALNAYSGAGFQNSRTLYGRNKETELLESIFERVCSGHSEIIMVKGRAGTGKTALVNRSIKPPARARGYFGYGKCDQVSSGAPYAPIIQAFEEIAAQLLTESRNRLEAWKKRLLHSLGPNAALITELIPRFRLIIGSQLPVKKLQPVEAQNRFRLVFQKLVRAFSTAEQPVVLFLDDLQWADPASLDLIRYLKSGGERNSLLLAGAYRDDEVAETHPLNSCLRLLEEAGMAAMEIWIDDLSFDQTCCCVAGVLRADASAVRPLSEQLYRRTGGNPLFLGQLLDFLRDEGVLICAGGSWTWDMEALSALNIPEDVVSFMTAKLRKLPEDCCGLLKMAACIGNSFDAGTLSVAVERLEADVLAGLQPAALAGIVLPRPDGEPGSRAFEFIHDRIHQAAYSLMTENEKKETHYTLGRRLLQNADGQPEDSLPVIIKHCNLGLDLLEDEPARLKMAYCNLAAAKKSKDVTDYHSARNFLSTGISLLPENPWLEHRELAFDLYLDCSLCAYLTGNIEEAERLSDLILKAARTNHELSEIYNLKMVMFAGTGKLLEAVPYGLKALGLLGVKLPEKPGKLILLKEILYIKCLLFNRKTEDLYNLPDMNDPTKQAAMKLMSLLGSFAISVRPNLYILLLLKGTAFAIKYGNSEMSSVAYAVYAVILREVLGDYKSALSFEKLSVRLAENYGSASSNCIVYSIAGGLVSHWTQPRRISIDYLSKSVENGIQSGELLYTGYSIYFMINHQYLMGMPLADVDQECRKWYGFVRQAKLDIVLAFIINLRRVIGTLRGLTEDDFQARMGEEQENSVVEKIINSKIEHKVEKYITDSHLSCMSGRYEEALALAEEIEKHLYAISGYALTWSFWFHQSLTITALYTTLPAHKKRRYRRVHTKNLRRFKKLSGTCPENFRHQYQLLQAETARLSGRDRDAMALYDQAIASARENGYIQIEAMAYELAARYYLSTGRDKVAAIYLGEACKLFDKWGAAVKSRSLAEEFPGLLFFSSGEDAPAADIRETTGNAPAGTDRPGAAPESDALTKALNIIQKSDPDKQLTDFLDNIFDYAGADQGFLILESDGEIYIEAVKEGPNASSKITGPEPAENRADLSRTVVRYVSRTQETVVLHDGDQEGIFSRDPFLAQQKPKTLLCMPFLFQGIFAGILYISGSLGADVFTQERLATIKRLASMLVYLEKLQARLEIGSNGETDKKSRLEPESLTNRELEVMELISAGKSNKEIAEELVLSPNTIKMHLSNIYGKLQVNRRVQAVNRAKELGILKMVK